MSTELHIRIREDVLESPEDLLTDFPFEDGQSIVSYVGGVLVVNLAGADDTTYVQDWYLNSNEDILSYYVVED